MANADWAGALASNVTAAEMADDLINQVRRISWALRPSELDELGLLAAVDSQVHDFQERTSIQTHLVAADELDCPPEAATVLFRALQELLTNVVRHAQAQRVDVRLDRADGKLVLAVHDDGHGIHPADAQHPGSLGLLGIRERVQKLGGSFTVEGSPENGTSALIIIPVVTPS